MPVPASINDLSTTAGSNSPGGGENPFPDLDNHIRALASFIAVLRDGKLDASTVSAYMLTVLNDADAATARTTLGAVGLTGSETVAGTKTFSSSPIAPTPTTGDNTTKVATTAFVKTAADAAAAVGVAAAAATEAKALGIGQTWQNLIASRAISTTYTNSTARPIQVTAAGNVAGATYTLSVDGVPASIVTLVSGQAGACSAIVPPGSTYRLDGTAGIAVTWSELR